MMAAARRSLLEICQLFLGVAVELRFQPVMDLGRMKTGFSTNFMRGELTTAGQLLQFASIALQEHRELLHGHHFLAHESCPSRPGKSNPWPPFNNCCRA